MDDAARIDERFAAALNAGDLDALMQLYEADASLMPTPGVIARGSAAIREALAGFLAMRPRMSAEARTLAQSGDIALVTAKWQLEVDGPDGKRATMAGQSIEVVRRQADGSYRFVVDFPFGVAS
jgi:uncharacterized protein (TIGR02246 family)